MASSDSQRHAMTGENWERVLSAAAHLQRIVPDAVLVGGTAAAIHAEHRFSYDDDHVVTDLKERFQEVLMELEAVSGWTTNRFKSPVMILGNLEGVETGIRNLIRTAPLQTEVRPTPYGPIILPTLDEMLRIKAYLVVTRNATRDYLDVAALADRIEHEGGKNAVWSALEPLDRLYPQENNESIILQFAKQMAEPNPKDLGKTELAEYSGISEQWKSWDVVVAHARTLATFILHKYAKSSGA